MEHGKESEPGELVVETLPPPSPEDTAASLAFALASIGTIPTVVRPLSWFIEKYGDPRVEFIAPPLDPELLERIEKEARLVIEHLDGLPTAVQLGVAPTRTHP